MLWTLLKVAVFVAIIAALTYGAGVLLNTPGGVIISFGGYEFALGPLQGTVLLILLVGLLWLCLRLAGLLIAVLRFINGDNTAISRYFDRNKERRGYRALTDAMLALAVGDGAKALSAATKAHRLLQKPELTRLITAQAAEMAGDRKRAEEIYKRLLENDRTRFVGVRGLMQHKLDEGDHDTARKLAQKALDLQPAHGETQDVLLKLQTGAEDWEGARQTLSIKRDTAKLPRDVQQRRDAVFALAQAREERAQGRIDTAHALTIEANRLSPTLIPAAVETARVYLEQDKPRLAEKVIKLAWKTKPHPALAAGFAAIEPDETPQERIKRFAALIKLAPDHPETRMMQAELHIAAGDYETAQDMIAQLIEQDPTTRVLTIMAVIERGRGAADATIQTWLTRALEAPRDPEWVCESCGDIHKDWEPVCLNCEAIDSLSWKRPAQNSVPKIALPAANEAPKAIEDNKNS